MQNSKKIRSSDFGNMIYQKLSNFFPILNFSEMDLKEKNSIPAYEILRLPNNQGEGDFDKQHSFLKNVYDQNISPPKNKPKKN